jgi:transposase
MTGYNHFANRVRLYPNKIQLTDLYQTVGNRRFVWNYFLALNLKALKAFKEWEVSKKKTCTPPQKRYGLLDAESVY